MRGRGGGRVPVLVAVLVGAAVGLALGAGAYVALAPVLEAADGPVRELQGLVWNLVPLGTAAGAVVGWVVTQRRRTGSR